MTLTNRLSLFLFVTLAVVLTGFSVTIYLLAKIHLNRQTDERLEAALNTLAAATEVGPDGVEWEPGERPLRFGTGDLLAWTVTDGDGRLVAQSDAPNTADLLAEASTRLRSSSQDTKRVYWQGDRWQASQRWVRSGDAGPANPVNAKEIRYPALVLTAALPLEPVRTTLRQLTAALAVVSACILGLALLLGRRIIHRALRPVRQMAADARSMNPDEPGRHLTTPATADELTDLGRSFNGLIDRLHESLERQKRFTGDASHQLRTPLTALLGQIEVSLRRVRSVEEYQQALSTAHSRAKHLLRIVESLLFLARADAETNAAYQERLDLAVWLPAHLANWAEHPRYRDIQLEECEGAIRAHPVLLGELLDVLLDNACRYSREGSAITVRAVPGNESVKVDVIDRGHGVAEADLPHLFSPFFRASEALRLNKSGVGLGLSIARRLADALGGTLNVTSQSGSGSCFTLTLPAYARDDARHTSMGAAHEKV